MSPIIFAVLAAGSFGLWTVFHKLASPHVSQIFGAILVSLTAVIFGGTVLLWDAKTGPLFTNPKGILFLVLAGVAAFFIDFLALLAYSRGLSLTVGGPIIIGGSMAVAIAIGLILGEPITLLKTIGIVFIVAGGMILAVMS